MNQQDPRRTAPDDQRSSHSAHHGHGWMMIVCCIPMLAIAIALVATGVASYGFLVVAIMCTAMMAMMMIGMTHGNDKQRR